MSKLLKSQILFAQHVALLIQEINRRGFGCTLGDAYRTNEDAIKYAKLSTGIPNSQHTKRLAIDLNLITPDLEYTIDYQDYFPFGKYWESLNPGKNIWGGQFKRLVDSNHFETHE